MFPQCHSFKIWIDFQLVFSAQNGDIRSWDKALDLNDILISIYHSNSLQRSPLLLSYHYLTLLNSASIGRSCQFQCLKLFISFEILAIHLSVFDFDFAAVYIILDLDNGLNEFK